ncbi:hypothetical protein AN191_09795 [Loktanella sp. 5RATIMAR09]|uniref:hypothetical protein n=1 Tax=Loktanella sp. 5RATIMAR09 TaxID=1225655 RepID=UPI0006EBDDBF|nr:hypothetical protein [Loktanella sp. 5RATIMAR09]KQI72444.1 hypothetical protein AN191_09795 [Loktanella sp. 5RATIMAR09]
MKLEDAEQLIRTLSETRSVEVKRWFDPSTPSGKAKLVKGLQALRNFDGGYFVVGFDDTTMQPDLGNVPSDVKAEFHPDVVQGIASRHSSEPFDVEVLFPVLDGQEFVVITVPSGVLSPVAVKKAIDNGSGHLLVEVDNIYFRTLQANNRVSSAKIPHRDLPELVRLCFENREADIGRFLRRHLSGLTPDTFRAMAGELGGRLDTSPSVDEDLMSFLSEGKTKFFNRVNETGVQLPSHGSFEVALNLVGRCNTGKLNREFLRLLDSSNPTLTGWPIWLDSSGFQDASSQPYVLDGGWEALILSLNDDWGGKHLDFMRKEPSGKFYLRRALEDDLTSSKRGPQPLTKLDFGISVLRVAEAIAVGRAFSHAMSCDPESTTLEFAFRWSGLKGRALSSWANPARYLSGTARAQQDSVTSRISVPLITAPETIVDQTHAVVSELFAVFEGYEMSRAVVDDLVTRLIERKL